MEEKEKKSAEQMAEEKTANNLMNFLIAKTYSRHSQMSEEEFLKEIGFDGSGKTEDEAIRISIFNVLVESTNQLLAAKTSLKSAFGLMKLYLMNEGIAENKNEENK